MDLGLTGRTALLLTRDDALASALEAALTAEGCTTLRATLDTSAVDVVSDHGKVDVVVVAPDQNRARTLDEILDQETLHEAWDDLVVATEVYRAAADGMVQRNFGRIVWITTSATKHLRDGADDLDTVRGLGGLGLNKCIVADIAQFNVTANAVVRGDDGADEQGVAALVAFLASSRAGYLDGVTIAVDGAVSPSVF